MIKKSKDYAIYCHRSTNHQYDGHLYEFHLEMVVKVANRFLYLIPEEFRDIVIGSCWCHDTIEDTRQTYNDVKEATCIEVADIVYAVTNEKGKTRKERANDKYYEGIRNTQFAIFVKLCDRISNMEYSISQGSKMAEMYKKENDKFISYLYVNSEYDDLFNYSKSLV